MLLYPSIKFKGHLRVIAEKMERSSEALTYPFREGNRSKLYQSSGLGLIKLCKITGFTA